MLTVIVPPVAPVAGPDTVLIIKSGPDDTTEMESCFVAVVEFISVTRTVKFEIPVAVGVPDIAPVVLVNVNPAGKLPALIDQV